jgi:hypothetical protein
MKQVIASAAVAAVVCVLAFAIEEAVERDESAIEASVDGNDDVAAAVARAGGAASLRSLSYTAEPPEDSWVNGARQSGPDDRLLSDADNSVCFLTKVEISGIRSPEDRGVCRIAVDEFTGFWKVTAEVPEGSQSEIRCNARCLVWE